MTTYLVQKPAKPWEKLAKKKRRSSFDFVGKSVCTAILFSMIRQCKLYDSCARGYFLQKYLSVPLYVVKAINRQRNRTKKCCQLCMIRTIVWLI